MKLKIAEAKAASDEIKRILPNKWLSIIVKEMVSVTYIEAIFI